MISIYGVKEPQKYQAQHLMEHLEKGYASNRRAK